MQLGYSIRSFLAATLGAVGIFLLQSGDARADSWAMPTVQTYSSGNGEFRLTVHPARIGSQLEYFKDRVAEEEGRQKPPTTTAMGTLERKLPDGKWQSLWIASLRNRVAPVRALVSGDGQRIVTFDDWHGTGFGPNVVAIYDESGHLLKSFALSDLVPDNYVAALPRSVSSIQWSGTHHIDDAAGQLLLQVVVPGERTSNEERKFVTLRIDMKDGTLVRPDGAEWVAALGAARQNNDQAEAAELARKRYLIEPLVAPHPGTQPEWHEYLRESFLRLTPKYLDGPVPSTTVLRDPKAPDYKASERWVRDRLAEEAEFAGDGATFASIGPAENFVAVLRKAALAVRANSLRDSTIYVAIDGAHRDAAIEALARTGAKVVWLDTQSAIPQRPERIPGSAEEQTANEAISRNMMRDASDAAADAARALP